MTLRLYSLAVLLLVSFARADSSSPLAEMRAAAEAVVEVDPEAAPRRLEDVLPWRAVVDGARRRAVREAVHAEVDRAWAERAQGQGPEAGKPGPGGAVRGPGRSEQARGAAAQAQEAARNRDVAQKRGWGYGNVRPNSPGPNGPLERGKLQE